MTRDELIDAMNDEGCDGVLALEVIARLGLVIVEPERLPDDSEFSGQMRKWFGDQRAMLASRID